MRSCWVAGAGVLEKPGNRVKIEGAKEKGRCVGCQYSKV